MFYYVGYYTFVSLQYCYSLCTYQHCIESVEKEGFLNIG